MWLSFPLADGWSTVGTIFTAVIGGVATVGVAVVSGLLSLRGSTRNTDAAREKAFDERVDAELARLREERAELERALDVERARTLRARFILAARGIDPALLDGPEAGVSHG